MRVYIRVNFDDVRLRSFGKLTLREEEQLSLLLEETLAEEGMNNTLYNYVFYNSQGNEMLQCRSIKRDFTWC